MKRPHTPLLDKVNIPSDLRNLPESDLPQIAQELRDEMIDAVSTTGGHLGAGLGVVELTVALHHVFDTRGTDNLIMSGIEFGTEGGVSISQDETSFKANAPGDVEIINPDPRSMGRQSWRMVPDA